MEKSDPTLDRIRQVRHEISAEVGHDPHRLVEYYMKLQEEHPERLVRPGSADAGKSAA